MLRLRRGLQHRSQELPELLHCFPRPALDGPQWLAKLAGDLRLSAAAVVGELDRLALCGGQRLERVADSGAECHRVADLRRGGGLDGDAFLLAQAGLMWA